MNKADHQLVQNVLDGNVTRGEFDSFQQRLRNERELARLYQDYALLHHTLHEEFEGSPPAETMTCGSRFRPGRPGFIAAVLILACAASAAWFLTKSWNGTSPVENAALVTFSLDAIWRTDGPARPVGGATGLPAGTGIRLLQGRAGIHLNPSVVAYLEGPAEIAMLSPNHLRLASGVLYLDAGESPESVTITTPRCSLTSQGAHYGVIASAAGATELHVARGTVQIDPATAAAHPAAGTALSISGDSKAVSIPMREDLFPRTLGRFRTVPLNIFSRQSWRIEHGNPSFSLDRIEGSNYAIHQDLPATSPDDDILLVTLEAGKPVSGDFHTDGWAGVSLYQQGTEMMFFGDAFGGSTSWALDVKNRTPIIPSNPPVSGPGTVTLRYHRRTGDVSLHEGGFPLKPALAAARIQPGLRFDRIRVAASTGASLTVNALSLKTGGR